MRPVRAGLALASCLVGILLAQALEAGEVPTVAQLAARMQEAGRKVSSYRVRVRALVMVGSSEYRTESEVYWRSPDRLMLAITMVEPYQLRQRLFLEGGVVHQATELEGVTTYAKYDASVIPLEGLAAGESPGTALNPAYLAEVALDQLGSGEISVSEAGLIGPQRMYLVEGALSGASRGEGFSFTQGMERVKFWVGAADYFPHKWEAYAGDKLLLRLELLDLALEPSDIEERLVSPVPAGVSPPDITEIVRSDMSRQMGKSGLTASPPM